MAAAAVTLALPFLKKWGVSFEAPEAAALTTIVTFAIQYVVPEADQA
jgi:hypothetical protein